MGSYRAPEQLNFRLHMAIMQAVEYPHQLLIRNEKNSKHTEKKKKIIKIIK